MKGNLSLKIIFYLLSSVLLISEFTFASLSIIKEGEEGVEIIWKNQKREELSFGYPPAIEEGRKVDNYPLPVVEFFLGIPQTGEISLTAQGGKETLQEGKLLFDLDGNPVEEIGENPRLAAIKSIEYLRDVRYARVCLFPVQWLGNGFRVYNEIKVNVSYGKPPVIVERADYFDDVYENSFINGERAKFYKCQVFQGEVGYSFFATSLNWVKIKIDSTGIYKITGADLKGIGVNLSGLNPKTLKIYHIGKFLSNTFYPDTMVELPIYVAGEEDLKFDEKDFILFYGQRLNSLYTNFNCYWLTWGLKEGKRMKRYLGRPLPSAPSLTTGYDSLHFEFDLLCPARSGLLWSWEYLAKARGEEQNVIKKFILPQAKTLEEITFAFFGKSDSGRLRFFLNENLLDSFLFKRENPPIPSLFKKTLREPISETVALKISLYGEKEQEIYLDYIKIIYEKDLLQKKTNLLPIKIEKRGNYNLITTSVPKPSHIFEIFEDTITGLPDPRLIEEFTVSGETIIFGKTFYYPTQFLIGNQEGWRRPLRMERKRPGRLRAGFSAHYLLITPDEWQRFAQVLCQYRQDNIVDLPEAKARFALLSEVYDEYTFGIEEPGAIKKFLQEKRPYYVILIGDATYDYRGNLPYKKYPGVPTYEYGYDFSANPYTDRAYACDAWYADFDGEGWSPDIILSRLPVRNEKEFNTFIQKIKNFEKTKSPYRQRFLLAGDDEFNGYYDRPDNIRFGTHIEQCEGICNLLGQEFEPVKIYLTEYPYSQPNDKPEARQSLISTLNEGVGLMTFFGHGWVGWLTHEKFLDLSSLSQLKNKDKPFFGFYGSCGVGKFDETEQECLAEELQRREGGAIATVAASKATSSSINYYFAQSLFAPLINRWKVPIGKGFLTAWGTDRKYHLFGDGATFIPIIYATQPMICNPCTLKPGAVITLQCDTARIIEGKYQLTACSPKLYRYYRSYLGSLTYTLPGEILFTGPGRFSENRINAKFLFPKIPYPDVRYVENGSYTLMPNSAKIRLWAVARDTGINYIIDNLPWSREEITSSDTIGPILTLYWKGKEIKDSTPIEKEFTLEGRIYDESGIALLKSYPLGFYLNNQQDFRDLRSEMEFQFSSYQNATFRYPFRLMEPCSLTFIIYDNLGNETKKSYKFKPISDTNLTIENCHYIQTGTSGYFTFNLSLPASVLIKIYSLSGRFVKEIATIGESGFNRVYFDGLDRFGKRIPKGIYLYQIAAQTLDQKRAKILDKFLLP
ncbi:MAG: C25 family cysteine peptidase [candidate division WOR-3 bacterium]